MRGDPLRLCSTGHPSFMYPAADNRSSCPYCAALAEIERLKAEVTELRAKLDAVRGVETTT